MKKIIINFLFILSFQLTACKSEPVWSPAPQIEASSKPVVLTREAGEFTIFIEHNIVPEIKIIQETEWLSRKVMSRTETNAVFTYGENTQGKAREAIIEITGDGEKRVVTIPVTQSVGVTNVERTHKIVNPDIGFYKAFQHRLLDNASETSFLTIDEIERWSTKHSVMHLRFGIDAFSTNAGGTDKDIPDAVINRLSNIFANIRATNTTTIIRFSYDVSGTYDENEPSIEWIKKHISQLGVVISANEDVISGVETGMFGPWGEQHSTAMSEIDMNYYDMLEAWLDATKDMSIGVTMRTPSHFLKWLNQKYSLSYTTANIGTFNIDSNVPAADRDRTRRVGCYNDGYLGSSTDLGTFENRDQEVAWISTVSKYTLYGGEVVADRITGGVGEYNKIAFLEVEGFKTRTSYLNIDWNYEKVISEWQKLKYSGVDNLYKDGILTDFNFVENRLGYRLFLSAMAVDQQIDASVDEKFNVELIINNAGFANVTNKKVVQIVLDNGSNTYFIDTDFDISSIEPKGQVSFDLDFDLPADIITGTYQVYMKISSVHEKTVSNKRTIEFANDPALWSERLGANTLGTMEVANGVSAGDDNSGNVGGGDFNEGNNL